MGRAGAQLIKDGSRVLTHCNAGALATVDYGTALGVLYAAREEGREFRVYCCETRPLLQGARLTAWELTREGIETTVICDNMAADLMRREMADVVLVGADRIAMNGDVANKVGTYGLAVLARAHRIDMYVAAPVSTFDRDAKTGADIPIEERSPEEVRTVPGGTQVAPAEADVYNPAFDVTPGDLVSGFVTEKGILKPPYEESIRRMMDEGA